jgi:Ca-activated chloride channel homolog
MADFSFGIDWLAALGVLSVALISAFFLKRRDAIGQPRLLFSRLQDLSKLNLGLKSRLGKLPERLLQLALLCFLAAFVDPRIFFPKKNVEENQPSEATEGIGIYFVLDRSGSMADSINVSLTPGVTQSLPKEEILRRLTTDFIKGNPSLGLSGRPNDMIGLIAFARIGEVLAPLTLDHQAILEDLAKIHVVQQYEDEGTTIGYAIYKTANLIAATRHYAQELEQEGKPAYDIKSTIIILVTDGLQEPNPLDKDNSLRTMDIPVAAQYAAKEHVKVYIVNLEPKLSTEEYAPFRHQMQEAAELTGGKLFFITNTTDVAQIYSEIDKLEKSKIPWQQAWMQQAAEQLPKDRLPNLFERISFAPVLIAIGLVCLFFAILLNTTLMRRTP